MSKLEVPLESEIQEDDSVEYEVEKIVDRCKWWDYPVGWKGYGPEDDTYQTLKDLNKVRHYQRIWRLIEFHTTRTVKTIKQL